MISVIVPVYNVEKYIEKCLSSIVCQKNVQYEIICVDDGSTDNSLDILQRYQKEYNQIKIIVQKNMGLSAARNTGLKAAIGDFVYFLDSDDYIAHIDALNYMETTMCRNELDVLYMDGDHVFESLSMEEKNLDRKNYYVRDREYGIYEQGYQLLVDMVKDEKYRTQVSLYCIRKSVLTEHCIDFPEGYYYEDNLFALKLIMKAEKVMHTKYVVFMHLVRMGSIMQSQVAYHNFASAFEIWKEMTVFAKQYEGCKFYYAIDKLLNGMKYFTRGLYNKMSEKDQQKVLTWSDSERKLFEQNIFLQKDILKPDWYRQLNLRLGDKVVIYGAGQFGSVVYKIALHDKTINIIGVVDKNADNIQNFNVPVLPIEAIDTMSYDYVLIAIKKQEVVAEVSTQLQARGVPLKKIKCFE